MSMTTILKSTAMKMMKRTQRCLGISEHIALAQSCLHPIIVGFKLKICPLYPCITAESDQQ